MIQGNQFLAISQDRPSIVVDYTLLLLLLGMRNKKSVQIEVGKLLTDFAGQLRYAFMSDFAIRVRETLTFYKYHPTKIVSATDTPSSAGLV